ncbi:MAG: hypothetical protein V3T83_20580 [Acidobacteriota bacterium]
MAQSAAKSYRWKPIEDLPQDHHCLSESELGWLAGVWLDQKAELQSHTGMQQFNQRLLRRWAIETGIIERIYTLDRGVAQMLVERGLEAARRCSCRTWGLKCLHQPAFLNGCVIFSEEVGVPGSF